MLEPENSRSISLNETRDKLTALEWSKCFELGSLPRQRLESVADCEEYTYAEIMGIIGVSTC